jgi:hypothetical protein
MTREEAFEREERRRLEDEEMRRNRDRYYDPDVDRHRWAMGKGLAEREYEDQYGPERGGGRLDRGMDWRVPGPYRGRGPKGYVRDDQRIREDVSERLMEHGQVDATDIDVNVRQGEVILRGSVRTRAEKRAAEDAAVSVPDVRDVRNELEVSEFREREQRRGQYAAMEGETERGRPDERTRYEERGARGEERVGSSNLSVFGIYKDRPAVEQAVQALMSAGFRNTDISVLFPDNKGTKDFAFEKGTKAPEGVVAGAGSGAVVGGVLGWLAGIGILAVPGIGPFIAAGPIVAALAGIGIGGTVGGITGALIGMGIPEYEAKRYEGRVKGGHALLSVHSDDRDWAGRAEKVLHQTGAEDIARAGEKSADFAETDKPMPRGWEYRQEQRRR